MPSAQKEEITDKRSKRLHSPYSQSGRKAKMTSSRGWSPSIWNALTFWKSGNASTEDEEDVDYQESEPSGADNSAKDLNRSPMVANIEENGDHDMSFSSAGNLSEDQVYAHLTMQSPRHVRFQLPSGDQERLNTRRSQLVLPPQPAPETPNKQTPHQPYVAPIPPSSPFHQSGSPHQDPLSKVSEYIDTVLRPRGGECTDVEALGLSMLIQSSVNQSGSRDATQSGTPANMNPFLLPVSNSASPSVSPSSSPIRPTFTTPSTSIAALLAPSSVPSTSPLISHTSPPSTSSPSRTLTQNPNGSIYYQGGGSARSRYRSPAFGTPPGRKKVAFSRSFGEGKRETPLVNGVDETPSPSDGKRRRIGEERDSSAAQASGSRPALPNGTSTPPRAAVTSTNGLRFGTSSPASRFMANTPARPSPLRQSVRAESSSPGSSSPGSVNGGSPRARFTDAGREGRSRASEKSIEIMAGIINDATPKKDPVPDVRNPYQHGSRSPTKRSRKTPAKAPRPPPRPARQTPTSPPAPPPKKLSALETIQRTTPQAQMGSKRSHTGMPPPVAPSTNTNGITKQAGASQAGSSSTKPFVIEVDDDDESESQRPPAKKQKSGKPEQTKEQKSADKEQKAQAWVAVEDVDMDATPVDSISRPTEVIEPNGEAESRPTQQQQQQETKRPIFTGPFKMGVTTTRFQSVPKEPSPLRQSFQPDTPPSPPQIPAPTGGVSSTAFASVSAASAFTSTSTVSAFTQTPAVSTFITMPAPPAFTPTPAASVFTPKPAPSAFAQSHVSSSSVPVPSVPSTFGTPLFGSTSTLSPFGSSSATTSQIVSVSAAPSPGPAASADTTTDWLALAKKQVLELPANSLPTFAFAFTTTTLSFPEYASQRDAALSVPATELPKFDFTTMPMPPPVPKVEVKAFDFAAAGMKPPVTSGWRCGVCQCNNATSATVCSVCTEPKP